MSENQEWAKYKKLDEIDHVLLRPARYVGSINPVELKTWYIEDGKIVEGTLVSSPAFHKLFDEIISNSADHARTKEGKNLNKITVDVDPVEGRIVVRDNGGIPVVKHPEYNQYIPEMIFGELRSGSNFSDDADSLTTGQNGEGASLVNIFSKEFRVQTVYKGMMFNQVFTDHMKTRTEPDVSEMMPCGNGTTISYKPDLSILNASFDIDTLRLIERRCYEIAFTNPNLEVFYNGKKININTFEDFIKAYEPECTIQSQDRWIIGVSLSKDGFKHVSFVNSTPSFDGGTHVDYVSEKIVEAVRSHIEKKTKQKVPPSDIKNNLRLFIDCKINNPRYNSQTKEKLITSVKDYGSQLKLSEKFIKQLLASPTVASIVEWAKRRQLLNGLKEMEAEVEAIRKAGYHDIPKYRPATSTNRDQCILFLAEGDSALNPFKAASDPKIHGLFPLRGKPENSYDKDVKSVFTQEILYVLSILNLKLGDTNYDKMRYKKVVIASDADLDGMHIRGLLVLFFKNFFPELLKQGRIMFLNTPIFLVKYKNKEYDFYDERSYKEFIEDKPKAVTKYCKGLGSHDSVKFLSFLSNPDCYVQVEYDEERDDPLLSLSFDPDRADDRKEWVALT
ncbi:DNA-dependent ATPase [Acinetobacter phage SH-Ab 15599]|nr:DNA-dependent ATPase [Acinetobacter phage SH-Ab 15599]